VADFGYCVFSLVGGDFFFSHIRIFSGGPVLYRYDVQWFNTSAVKCILGMDRVC
jgi:hypothetical protein